VPVSTLKSNSFDRAVVDVDIIRTYHMHLLVHVVVDQYCVHIAATNLGEFEFEEMPLTILQTSVERLEYSW
jgi:hypothetical protein